jgi:hypothetical protein
MMPTMGFLTGSRERRSASLGHERSDPEKEIVWLDQLAAEQMVDMAMASLARTSKRIAEEAELMRQWNLDLDNRLQVSRRKSLENARLVALLQAVD